MSIYKPLTPTLRKTIMESTDDRIRELNECQPTAYVNAQVSAYRMFKNIINGLPDGYLLPLKKGWTHE